MRIDWSPLIGYDVFISYKRGREESSEYAKRLRVRLEGANLRCFLDDSEAPLGEPLTPTIERGIKRSRAIIILCTEAALRSPWVEREVQSFAKKPRAAFIPVSFTGCLEAASMAGHPVAAALPRETIWLNEDNRVEPSDAGWGAFRRAMRSGAPTL
jgi:hypothetical protein